MFAGLDYVAYIPSKLLFNVGDDYIVTLHFIIPMALVCTPPKLHCVFRQYETSGKEIW